MVKWLAQGHKNQVAETLTASFNPFTKEVTEPQGVY